MNTSNVVLKTDIIPAVDWMGIYETAKNAVSHQPCLRLPADVALRELRTIHMGGGRQNGKTSWAVNMMAFDGTIVIARDKVTRQAINRKYLLLNPPGHISINIPADCPDPAGVIEGILQDYYKAGIPKVFTLMDLASILDKEPEKLAGINRVIIDDFSYNTKIRDIYTTLACLDNPDMIVVALN